MRRRVIVLPVAAAVIAGLCVYKVTRPPRGPATGPEELRRAPPGIALRDHETPPRLVRLESYLGRHPVLVVFFDGEAGADKDATLMRLVRERDRLARLEVKVLAVTAAVPQFNRAAIRRLVAAGELPDEASFPFPLLSDVSERDPSRYLEVHRQWGRMDEQAGRARPGVFSIDRTGRLLADPETGHPRPLEDPGGFLDELLAGE